MPYPNRQHAPDGAVEDRLARLEERLARLEARLDVPAVAAPITAAAEGTPAGPFALPPFETAPRDAEELEVEVGRNWFAVAGIAALAVGLGFLLALPYRSLPAAVPAVAGGAIALAFLLLAPAWQRSLGSGTGALRAAGMCLLCLAALRLFFFGSTPALAIDGVAGRALLLLVVAANVTLAWRLNSRVLMGLALATGHVVALAVNAGWFVLPMFLALAVVAAAASRREHWRGLLLFAAPLTYATYFLWAMGNPVRFGGVHFVDSPAAAPGWVLALVLTYAAAALYRRPAAPEDAIAGLGAGCNCVAGYGVLLVHTAAAFPAAFASIHAFAAVAFLGLAVAFFQRGEHRVSTFFYAMTGYGALSMAILKVSAMPEVFVWLSLQSLVVVTTAIWFRSRFIVVANFFIFLAIVLAYVMLAGRETGISVGFGIVALVSARVLNWQQRRLELKTELMRNAYLASAFLVFPYALAHLLPAKLVVVAWAALASAYYVLNLVVQNQKYRWMGHGTLVLTMIYVVVVGTSRFEPVYRILSFLVLGAVLLMVSLVFTGRRKRQRTVGAAETDPTAEPGEHPTLNV